MNQKIKLVIGIALLVSLTACKQNKQKSYDDGFADGFRESTRIALAGHMTDKQIILDKDFKTTNNVTFVVIELNCGIYMTSGYAPNHSAAISLTNQIEHTGQFNLSGVTVTHWDTGFFSDSTQSWPVENQ